MSKFLGALIALGLFVTAPSAHAHLFNIDTFDEEHGSISAVIAGDHDVTVTKIFTSIGEMEMDVFVTDPGPYIFTETITNNTGIDWTDFHWNLEIAVFEAATNLGPFTINSAMSSETSLWVDGILESGESFSPIITVTAQESPFFFDQFPTIGVPEPGTLTLLGLGLVGLGLARRRKAA